MGDAAEIAARKEARARLEKYGRTIGSVDGTNRDELRSWIDKIEHAKEWTGTTDRDVLEMVGYLITGALAHHVRRFVKTNQGVTWIQVRDSITENFLDLHEGRMLRQQIEKIKQRAYEDPREFGLRFSDAVGQAYTTEQQAVDVVQERLVAQFINGLRNVAVRRQVYLGSPKTLSAAIEVASTIAGAFELADMERKEEPMEVGAMGFVTTKPVQPQLSEVAESITALGREETAVKQRLDALPATGAGRGRGRGWSSGGRGQPNGWAPGQDRPQPDHSNLTCYRCGQQGHI